LTSKTDVQRSPDADAVAARTVADAFRKFNEGTLVRVEISKTDKAQLAELAAKMEKLVNDNLSEWHGSENPMLVRIRSEVERYCRLTVAATEELVGDEAVATPGIESKVFRLRLKAMGEAIIVKLDDYTKVAANRELLKAKDMAARIAMIETLMKIPKVRVLLVAFASVLHLSLDPKLETSSSFRGSLWTVRENLPEAILDVLRAVRPDLREAISPHAEDLEKTVTAYEESGGKIALVA
jgi:hypothetical protein